LQSSKQAKEESKS
jgi:hypothetical protein